MVRFERDRYTIEVFTGCDPVEDFMMLQSEIAHVFGMLDADNMPQGGLYNLAYLLKSLQPEWTVARRMTTPVEEKPAE